MTVSLSPKYITLKNDAVQVIVRVNEAHRVVLQDILPTGYAPQPSVSPYFEHSSLPICEVRLGGDGNLFAKSSKSLVGGQVGTRLTFTSSREDVDTKAQSKTLHIEMFDEETNIFVISHLTIFDGCPVVRSSATVRNDGKDTIIVSQVSSLLIGFATRSPQWWSDYLVGSATNTVWCEAQWRYQTLSEAGVDDVSIFGREESQTASLASYTKSNRGTFSSQGHLPMGVLKHRNNSESWVWQVENNGSWRWDVGDYEDNVFIGASGPTGIDHDWRLHLKPSESFTTVTAAICHIFGPVDAGFAALTRYRRRIRRVHQDNKTLPIIFNDYMNCLMGDPDEQKILALIDPVAKSGAEYFVIDCGWYADDSNWWDDVGDWEPSKKRFPSGFKNLLDTIRAKGLKPGLWLEPEVIGVRSAVAKTLPDDAFFQRDGKRVFEKKRYHLDFRHPAVIKRMDAIIDRLVIEYGAEYFKFDYNVDITDGTDTYGLSSGVGQLEHNRAYLAWVGKLFDRHPGLVIENCSSGAQRLDYAMLAVHPLLSTSDQQDPAKYAAIACAIHTAVTPEQGASWAYPQGLWDDETNALTVTNSLLGRVHLSGRLDAMSEQQLKLVYEGMGVYKSIRGDIQHCVPFWPLGLPRWHDEWLALGLALPSSEDGTKTEKCYLTVWRRGGEPSNFIPIEPLKSSNGAAVSVKLLYPTTLGGEASWDSLASGLNVQLASKLCARLYELRLDNC